MRKSSLLLIPFLMLGLSLLPGASQGGPPPVKWILAGGADSSLEPDQRSASLGRVLHASGLAPHEIPSALNPATQAQGHIIVGEECNGKEHYHGTLFGVDDGGGGCGWGVVINYNDAPPELGPLATAIDSESLAYDLAFVAIPPDYDGAADALRTAEAALRLSNSRLSTPPYKPLTRRSLAAQILKARVADRLSITALTRLHNGRGRANDIKATKQRLKTALKVKRGALRTMVKVRKLLAGDGED